MQDVKNSGIYGNSVLSSQLLNSKWFLNKKLIETNEADKKKKMGGVMNVSCVKCPYSTHCTHPKFI